MKRQVKVVLLAALVLAGARAAAKQPVPSPYADLADEAVAAAQQDKGDKKPTVKDKKKDKQKEKEKEKPPPLALSDFLPQENPLQLGEYARAPEFFGDFPPTGILYTIPPQFVRLPDRTIFIQVVNPDGRITIIKEVIPGATVAVPGTGGPAYLPSGSGGFKIADNNSPMPQDRVYLNFNFFNDFLAATNSSQGTGVQNMNVYRESLGMEKTFLDGYGSVGAVLPLNTLTAQSSIPSINGTHTAIGDLSVYARYALYRDSANNNWVSGGLAVTAPTGPINFAGISGPSPAPNTTVLQPFGSALWNFGNLYVQGFTSVYTPTDHASSPVYFFNDIGVGYFLYRAPVANRWLTGVAPTFEVHVADPLNYRGPITASNPFGAFDIVDLGAGMNVLMGARSRLGFGVVTPVTGPRPFNLEALVQFRMSF